MKELLLADYLMERDVLYMDEWTFERELNANDLILRVNNLFRALKQEMPPVTSGWRPLAVNMKAGGAKRSLHLIGKAVDLADKLGTVKEAILNQTELLLDYGLWMEDPERTPGWVHLDTGIRDSRLRRIFLP